MECSDENPLYDSFTCDECRGYGDDYYEDDNGDMVDRCSTCPFSYDYRRDDD